MIWVWAEAREAGALAFEGGELRGDLHDIRLLPDLLDAALGDPHAPIHSAFECSSVCTKIPELPIVRAGLMLLLLHKHSPPLVIAHPLMVLYDP